MSSLSHSIGVPSSPFPPIAADPAPIRVSEVLSALSFALDLTEGQPMGHSVRTCVLGMRIAQEIGIPLDEQGSLYYALLMKDAGCSTNASRLFQIIGTDEIKAKRDVKTTDWTKLGWESLQYALSHVKNNAAFLERMRSLFDVAVNQKEFDRELVQIRCERGANIARRMGLSEATASAIHSLDEQWNGRGNPDGLRGETIPLFSRIANLAQTLDVFNTAYGPKVAMSTIRKRSGRWFDPALVMAADSLDNRGTLWTALDEANWLVIGLEPSAESFVADEKTLDNICMAFADVIDAKSPFTYRHSTGVAAAAVTMGQTLGLNTSEVSMLRRAALLHDIGKLSVPNSILEKPAKLTDSEWDVVKKHPFYSYEILKRIPGFNDLSEMAASHHEKLDGSGYFRGLTGEYLSLPTRILVVADIYDALAAKRPYRDALPLEKVMSIMGKESPIALDANVFEALRSSCDEVANASAELAQLSINIQKE